MVWNDGTANGKRHVIAVKRQILGARKVGRGKHVLVIEPIRGGTVELVRTRPRGEDLLDSSGPAIFARKGVDLNAGFLNGFRIRGEIENSLADAAGNIEAIDDVH